MAAMGAPCLCAQVNTHKNTHTNTQIYISMPKHASNQEVCRVTVCVGCHGGPVPVCTSEHAHTDTYTQTYTHTHMHTHTKVC